MTLTKLLIYTAKWLKGGLMEWVPNYVPNVFENEVPVFKKEMTELFKKHKVYVFGYGSLLYPEGWFGRWMLRRPTEKKMIECKAHGFERGPWGVFGNQNYYGIIPEKDAVVNGIVTRIWDMQDWVNLMSTEMIAGLYRYANYRVVDITDNISDWTKKPKSARIHCVMNQPENREQALTTVPAHNYYNRVWEGVTKHRSPKFIEEFLAQGGFRNNFAVTQFLNARAGVVDLL